MKESSVNIHDLRSVFAPPQAPPTPPARTEFPFKTVDAKELSACLTARTSRLRLPSKSRKWTCWNGRNGCCCRSDRPRCPISDSLLTRFRPSTSRSTGKTRTATGLGTSILPSTSTPSWSPSPSRLPAFQCSCLSRLSCASSKISLLASRTSKCHFLSLFNQKTNTMVSNP